MFPFLQGLEARKVQRYKWGAYCRTNWRCTAVLSWRRVGVGVSETFLGAGNRKTREGCGGLWDEENSGKIAGKNWEKYCRIENALNSRISGTGTADLGSTLPRTLSPASVRCAFEWTVTVCSSVSEVAQIAREDLQTSATVLSTPAMEDLPVTRQNQRGPCNFPQLPGCKIHEFFCMEESVNTKTRRQKGTAKNLVGKCSYFWIMQPST